MCLQPALCEYKIIWLIYGEKLFVNDFVVLHEVLSLTDVNN